MGKSVEGKLQKGKITLQDMKTRENSLKAIFVKIYLLTLCSNLKMCNKMKKIMVQSAVFQT